MRNHLLQLSSLATAFLLIQGCAGEAPPTEVDNGFESDDPGAGNGGSRGGVDGDMAAAPSEAGANTKEANRAVEEADIIQTEGNRLYALSRYGGLAIVDTTNPDQLKLVGRKRLGAIPFEMYLRDGRAYVMMNDFGHYERANGSMYGRWVISSEIVAFDVSNPAAITEVNRYDVPGNIADSRLVGDALYLVTYEDGYCWGCGTKPSTIVTSFAIGTTITKVDQIPFTSPNQGYSSWQRSVSATNERLYIAGPEWSWNGSGVANSVVQVVDIKDPAGHLKKGADIAVAGQINSRWQMDEYQGALRVVSQFGPGWGANSVNPKVQTYTIVDSNTFTPAGQTELVLPHPENLRSVRFDGPRGYAITSERKDPLFTIDLSNPALPKQAGEITMPGWITHMEPRGDRLVGFGFEDTNWSSKLAVSLFDVSNLAAPKLLKRVAFGAASGQYAEDADRIHKSVRVLDDQGLVLVPFASYGKWWGGSCEAGQSGIQIIDYSKDDLVLRGVAPQYGQPRRAILSGNRILGVSDRNVSTFDISSKDAPKKTSEIDLANPAYRMVKVNDQVASISNDWWTSEVVLSLTPSANADDADVSGKVSLASLAEANASYCTGGSSVWTEWYSARLFAQGNHVIVTVPVHTYSSDGKTSTSSGKIVVGVVDVSNPKAPKLVAKSEVALASHTNSYYGYWGFMDGYGYYGYWGGGLLGSGEAIVQIGTKLAYLENDVEYFYSPNFATYVPPVFHRTLHVIDVANPLAPAVAAPVSLADARGASPLLVQGNDVLTSRWGVSPNSADKVKFYVDRIDLSGPTPVREASVNTPGSLLAVDGVTGRFVTADYSKKIFSAANYNECSQKTSYRGRFDETTHACVSIARNFKLVDVNGTSLKVRNTFTPTSQNIGGVTAADDRIYVTHYPVYDYTTSSSVAPGGAYVEPKRIEDGGLWVLGGVRDGNLRMVNQLVGDANWPLAALGSKVAVYTEGGLAVYDTSIEGAAPTELADQKLRGWGYSSHVILEKDRATCSLGDWGIQTVNLKP